MTRSGTTPDQFTGARPTRGWSMLWRVILAMLILNIALSFNNVWPTLWLMPDHRIAPEFVLTWIFLLVLVAVFRQPPRWLIWIIALVFFFLFIGRYLEVTTPSIFGRAVNFYWDGYQVPRFLAKAIQNLSMIELIGLVLAIVLGVWALFRLMRWGIDTLTYLAAPAALRSPVALLLSAVALVATIGNYNGVQATWPYISKPVMPTYMRQADLLMTVFIPSRRAKLLPDSPKFDTNLAALNGADVTFLLFESYGAVTYDKPDIAADLKPARDGFAKAVRESGKHIASGMFTAATIGGASELSHLSLLSGIDLSDPLRHDVLLTTERKTMIDLFSRNGYRTFGLYPALSWDWPEKAFYGFDVFIDGPLLTYNGPKFGLWWIPDQYTIAEFQRRHPSTREGAPRFLFFPTITSHAPFRPTPPYQPDWPRVLTDNPFDAEETERAMAEKIDWSDTYSGYANTLIYTFKWLSDFVGMAQEREQMLVIIGDHQPMGTITGPSPRWDVPVHIVSPNKAIIDKLVSAGMTADIDPAEPVLGKLNDLGAMLLKAFHKPKDVPAIKTSAR